MREPTVYADGYGVWHASVPIGTVRLDGGKEAGRALARAGRTARRLILDALIDREPPSFDPRSVRIRRTFVADVGKDGYVVHYKEVAR